MSKMKQLDEIAQGVADVTLELMNNSVDWQLGDFPHDGDEYSAIHAQVIQMAISKMYKEVNIGGPAGISNDENVLDADHASL